MNGSEPTTGQREGRVEVCYENAYHAICDDLWDLNDAQVVCRQLNFPGDGKILLSTCTSQMMSRCYNTITRIVGH